MRQLLHTRETQFRGYRRNDGLWDIEAELCDIKGRPLEIVGERTIPVGEALHDLIIRLTIDSQYTVRAVDVAMRSVPHAQCPSAIPPMQSLVGTTLAAGWRKTIESKMGGCVGCTHLREMLMHMGTVAFQTLSAEIPQDGDEPPLHLGKCVSWDFAGRAVQRTYPKFYRAKPAGEGVSPSGDGHPIK